MKVKYTNTARMFQYSQVHQYNTPHLKKEAWKTHDHLFQCCKSIWQNSTSFHDKTYQSECKGNICQHNKRHLQQSHSQYIVPVVENWKKGFGTRHRCLLLPYLFNTVFEVLAIAIKKESCLENPMDRGAW